MKRPSFQFYPGDWTGNSNLRRCSHELKGIWIDVLCVLHDQDDYGIARWSLKEIAEAAGTTVAKLKILVDRKILKGADKGQQCEEFSFEPTGSGRKKKPPVLLIPAQDGPIWFSSRMVVDEYKRIIRADNGQEKEAPYNAPKGGIGATPKQTPDTAPSRAGASSSSSSSTDVSNTQSNSTVSSVTPAASVCLALKQMGFLDVNPSHPKLIALMDAGAVVEEFTGMAATVKVKTFGYVLGAVERSRAEALSNPVAKGQVKPKEDVAWRSNDSAIVSKANELGISTIGKDRFQLLSAIDNKIEQQRKAA